MVTPGTTPPTPPLPAQNWRTLAVGLGLFCAIGGLFLAAGFKQATWPKVIAVGGFITMVVGLIVNAVLSRARPSSGD